MVKTMNIKINKDIENIIRMREIAKIYSATNQNEKSEKYHKIIIEICEKYPKNERILTLKLQSLTYLKKSYKSLETTNELLNLNPNNITALINIAEYLKEEQDV